MMFSVLTKTRNKLKIINDPVHGFINIPHEIIFDLLEHPFVQRLRRIRQLGITNYVYPGATHTRFHHAIGACYLMQQAIEGIRSKGHEITDKEAEASSIAILLHDIGHGPFSHSLEHSIIQGINHEMLSLLFMNQLNGEFDGKLTLAIDIFKGVYHKRFLHELVSSQLDMDRLDYLRRDSFFTGVTEGAIGSERIIKMLNVVNDKLVVEAKGIYSVEKFLIARRLMYWQVYLHKTVIATETVLINLLKRAKYLLQRGEEVFMPPALLYFFGAHDFGSLNDNLNPEFHQDLITNFNLIDDNDIFVVAKVWLSHPDKILSTLSYNLLNRRLPSITIRNQRFTEQEVENARHQVHHVLGYEGDDIDYFVQSGVVSNSTYDISDEKIQILNKKGELTDVSQASDVLNISVLNKKVEKYYLCLPKLFTIK